MNDVEEIIRRLIEISEVKPGGGWQGWVSVREGGKERFSRAEWLTLLSEPERMLERTEGVIKRESGKAVVIRYLAIGGRGVKAVIKWHRRGSGVRELLRSMGPPRGLRNFVGAVKTRQKGLPVADPLAGLYRRRFLFCEESIYISEYVEGSNLYDFLKGMRASGRERHLIVRRLSEQIAEIFAGLHKNRLWHRDAKATNFIVCGDRPGNYRVVLTDMDGIRQYFVRRKECQMRGLWQLAASVMGLKTVRRTDYLRVFRAYCEAVGIPAAERPAIFRELSEKAQAKFQRKH
jgi:hypothetical protein